MVMFGHFFMYSSYSPFSLNPKVPKRPTVTVVSSSVPQGLEELTSSLASLELSDPQAVAPSARAIKAAALAAILEERLGMRCMGITPGGEDWKRSQQSASAPSPRQ